MLVHRLGWFDDALKNDEKEDNNCDILDFTAVLLEIIGLGWFLQC
jgi:hypothetical protein